MLDRNPLPAPMILNRCATSTATAEELFTWRRKTRMNVSAAPRAISTIAATAPAFVTYPAQATRCVYTVKEFFAHIVCDLPL